MTKDEAIQEMKKGVKITHTYFASDEWMTMKGNKIVLEDGVKCWPEEFWTYRTDKGWLDGFEIYKA